MWDWSSAQCCETSHHGSRYRFLERCHTYWDVHFGRMQAMCPYKLNCCMLYELSHYPPGKTCRCKHLQQDHPAYDCISRLKQDEEGSEAQLQMLQPLFPGLQLWQVLRLQNRIASFPWLTWQSCGQRGLCVRPQCNAHGAHMLPWLVHPVQREDRVLAGLHAASRATRMSLMCSQSPAALAHACPAAGITY